MNKKIYTKLLVALVISGILSVLALAGYTGYLHSHCSILTFIANEGM